MPKSRPNYTDEEKDEIIAHVLVNVACGRFVNRIFREDKTTQGGVCLPAESTFWLWLFQDEDKELSEKLTRAREFGAEKMVDEAVIIADDGSNDTYTIQVGDGVEIEKVDYDHIQRSKLRVDTRLKLAALLKPRKYGAKVDLTSGGEKIGYAEAMKEAQRRLDALDRGGKNGADQDRLD